MTAMRIVLMLFVVVLLAGCATVPVTGRKQLSFVPASQLASLSRDSYTQLLSQSKLSQDTASVQLVQQVGKRVAASAERFMRENGMADRVKDFDWEFNLIEDNEQVNAFAMPGGKIGVYTGILPVTQDAEGLATVMAHEVAHVIANHSGERMSQLLLANLGNVALSQALKEKPDKTRQLTMIAYGLGANIGVLLPYSRTHEREADRIGLILMAQAGYRPEAAIGFWERMAQKATDRPPVFLSTHPNPEERIENIRRDVPMARQYFRP